jgi:hypothetical protein
MKKGLFVLLAVVAFLSTQVWAAGEGPMFGVKGGVSIAKLRGDDAEDPGDTNSSRLVGIFGGFVDYPIGQMLSVQGELLYAMKGVKAKWTVGDDEYNGTTKLTYIEVPVLLKANIPMDGSVSPHVFAGPALAFKLSAEHETKGPGASATVDLDEAKGVDVGVVVGAGVGFPMGPKMISVEARYNLGLMNAFDKFEGETKEPDIKNSVISFLLGVGF